jgi:hypothetical protein
MDFVHGWLMGSATFCLTDCPEKIRYVKMEDVAPAKSHLAPAADLALIRRNLAAVDFCPRSIRFLLEHTDFPAQEFRSHQICFLNEWSRETLGRELRISELCTIFDLTERTVRRALLRGPEDPNPPGRHRALSPDVESDLITLVIGAFRSGNPLNNKELLKTVRERYDPKLTKGWVHAFVGRHLDVLQECRSLPLEDARLTVPREQLEEHITNMKTLLVGKYSELVFNLDEVGSSEWEERKPKKVIAPRSIPADEVYHSVSRKYRHVTLMACVSAAGDALTPMVISGPPIRDSLWALGLRRDEDVMVRQRNPAYISEELFFEYLTNVLVPYVAQLRNKSEFMNEPAVLLMDSALPHVSERVLRLLGQSRIMAIVFPAHTTNIFQALDLAFFGVLKKLKQTATGEFDDDSMNDQITKLVHAYEQTATSITIRGCFRKAGLYPDIGSRPCKLRFDEERLRTNPGFKEIWERNIKIEELRRRRRLQRFGWINSEFFI